MTDRTGNRTSGSLPVRPAAVGPDATTPAGVVAPAIFPRTSVRRGPLWRLVDAILLLGVLGMLLTVALQVASRAIGNSVPWTEELTRYLFIWTAFFGLAAGSRGAENARVFMIAALLPAAFRGFLVHLYVLAGVTFFSVVAFKGGQLTLQQIRNGETSPVLGIGMFLVTLPVAVSAILAIVGHVVSAYGDRATRTTIEDGGVPL